MARKMVEVVKRYHGQTASAVVERNQLLVRVIATDVRFAYGRWDFLVTPVHGEGTAWMTASKLKFDVDNGKVSRSLTEKGDIPLDAE